MPAGGRRSKSYTGADERRGRSVTPSPVEPSAGSGVRSREPLTRADRIKIALLVGLLSLSATMLGAGAWAYSSLSRQLLELQ